jgi:hypothetical protein
MIFALILDTSGPCSQLIGTAVLPDTLCLFAFFDYAEQQRESSMACDKYNQLLNAYKTAQQDWEYFAHPHNKVLRQTSDRKSNQCARLAEEDMKEIQESMRRHREGCDACKSARKRLAQKKVL